VTTLNKFLGPDSLMVAGEPVEGRSGGGLFSADGRLIGVCNAADKEDREGLYAALASIHGELDRRNLAFVYNATNTAPAAAPKADLPRAAMVAVNPPPMPRRMPSPSAADFPVRQASLSSTEPLGQDNPPLSATEQAALSEIRRKLQEGAEVVCIVRSRTDPTARSEVITLDRASPNFLRQLAGEALTSETLTGDARQLTSLAVPPKNEPTDSRAIRRPSSAGSPASSGGWQSSPR